MEEEFWGHDGGFIYCVDGIGTWWWRFLVFTWLHLCGETYLCTWNIGIEHLAYILHGAYYMIGYIVGGDAYFGDRHFYIERWYVYMVSCMHCKVDEYCVSGALAVPTDEAMPAETQ